MCDASTSPSWVTRITDLNHKVRLEKNSFKKIIYISIKIWTEIWDHAYYELLGFGLKVNEVIHFMHSDWQSEKNLSFDLGIFAVSFTAPSALPWPLLACNPEDSPDPAWLCQCPGVLCPAHVEGDSLQQQQHRCGLDPMWFRAPSRCSARCYDSLLVVPQECHHPPHCPTGPADVLCWSSIDQRTLGPWAEPSRNDA